MGQPTSPWPHTNTIASGGTGDLCQGACRGQCFGATCSVRPWSMVPYLPCLCCCPLALVVTFVSFFQLQEDSGNSLPGRPEDLSCPVHCGLCHQQEAWRHEVRCWLGPVGCAPPLQSSSFMTFSLHFLHLHSSWRAAGLSCYDSGGAACYAVLWNIIGGLCGGLEASVPHGIPEPSAHSAHLEPKGALEHQGQGRPFGVLGLELPSLAPSLVLWLCLLGLWGKV